MFPGCYLVALGISLVLTTICQAAEERKTDAVGPWQIEVTFSDDRFDDCAITRKLEGELAAAFRAHGRWSLPQTRIDKVET